LVPKRGPHCPTALSIQSPAARFVSVAVLFATQGKITETLINIWVARNMPKYLGAVELVVAKMMKPIAAIMAAALRNGPRILNLSESQQKLIMPMKQRRYGGAASPLDWRAVKEPISEIIVGRKRGRDAKETLQPKYIRPSIKLL